MPSHRHDGTGGFRRWARRKSSRSRRGRTVSSRQRARACTIIGETDSKSDSKADDDGERDFPMNDNAVRRRSEVTAHVMSGRASPTAQSKNEQRQASSRAAQSTAFCRTEVDSRVGARKRLLVGVTLTRRRRSVNYQPFFSRSVDFVYRRRQHRQQLHHAGKTLGMPANRCFAPPAPAGCQPAEKFAHEERVQPIFRRLHVTYKPARRRWQRA